MLEVKPTIQLQTFLAGQGITLPDSLSYIRGSDTLPPPLSQEEEEKNVALMMEGSLQAKQTLIEHNLRLVVFIAKRFTSPHADIEDFISIGTIGLVKAINTYDPSKNIRLATYATHCVENEILMFLRKANRNTVMSFDEILHTDKDGNTMVMANILGIDEDTALQSIEDSVDKELLLKAIEKLPEREKEIIVLRFGLDGNKGLTQQEVADKIGISQSYLSKLEKQILSRLKHEITRNG